MTAGPVGEEGLDMVGTEAIADGLERGRVRTGLAKPLANAV